MVVLTPSFPLIGGIGGVESDGVAVGGIHQYPVPRNTSALPQPLMDKQNQTDQSSTCDECFSVIHKSPTLPLL
jgi:hypothetical protein